MSKVVLETVASGYNLSKINTNFQKIATELNNKVLYRTDTGVEPNTLEADQDANNFTFFNMRDAVNQQEPVTLSQLEDRLAGIVASGIDLDADYSVTGIWSFLGNVNFSGIDIDFTGATNVDFTGVNVIGLSGFDPAADYTITGDWTYNTQSSYNRPAGAQAIVLESTAVGAEYTMKWGVDASGIVWLPGLAMDADIPDSQLKYNGDNDQWEFGSGDGLWLRSVPNLYLEDNVGGGQIPALGRDIGDRLQLGSTGYTTQLLSASGDVQIQGTGASTASTLQFVGSGNGLLGEVGFDTFGGGDMQIAVADGTKNINIFPGGAAKFNYRSREVGTKAAIIDSFAASITDGEGEQFLRYTGTGGHTLTINNELTFENGHSFVLANKGTGNLTITAAPDILNWFDGAAVTTGNRTLAPGGICTIIRETAAEVSISGNGGLS